MDALSLSDKDISVILWRRQYFFFIMRYKWCEIFIDEGKSSAKPQTEQVLGIVQKKTLVTNLIGRKCEMKMNWPGCQFNSNHRPVKKKIVLYK